MPQQPDILSVLSGNKAAKLDVTIDTMSILYVGIALTFAIAIGIFLGSLIKSNNA